MTIEALIFDCDGTLADSMPLHYVSWSTTLARYGIRFDEDRFYELAGAPTEKIVTLLAAEQSVQIDPQHVTREKAEEFLKLLHEVQPILAVADIVRQNRGRLKMAVASGSARHVVEMQLRHFGMDGWFDAIISLPGTSSRGRRTCRFQLSRGRIGWQVAYSVAASVREHLNTVVCGAFPFRNWTADRCSTPHRSWSIPSRTKWQTKMRRRLSLTAPAPESYWSPFNATIDPATGQLTLSFPADASGQVDYVVSATDTGGMTVQATLSVTVNEVNDFPTGPAGVVTLTLLDAPAETVVDLWEYFADVEDGPDMTYEIIDATITSRAIFGSGPTIDADDFLRATASEWQGGTSQMTIRATDSSGASVTGTFEFRTAPPVVSIVDKKHTGETAAKAGYFELKLSGAPVGLVEVPFQLTAALNASAAAGLPAANYVVTLSNASLYDAATQSGVLKFDGVKTITLSIEAPEDATKEAATNISLALSSGTNYNAGTMTESMQVYDDDSGAVVYIAHVKHTREGAAESDYGEFTLESIGKTIPFEWCYLNNGATCDAAPADAVFLIWDYAANALVPWTDYPNVPEYKVSYQLSGSVAAQPGDGDHTVTMGSLASNKTAKITITPPLDDGDVVDEFVKLKLVPRSGPWGIVQTADGDHLGCFQTGSYALGAPDSGVVTVEDVCSCLCFVAYSFNMQSQNTGQLAADGEEGIRRLPRVEIPLDIPVWIPPVGEPVIQRLPPVAVPDIWRLPPVAPNCKLGPLILLDSFEFDIPINILELKKGGVTVETIEELKRHDNLLPLLNEPETVGGDLAAFKKYMESQAKRLLRDKAKEILLPEVKDWLKELPFGGMIGGPTDNAPPSCRPTGKGDRIILEGAKFNASGDAIKLRGQIEVQFEFRF